MKVVLDTNVLIAALIANGVCADLLEHCVLRHTIVGSDVIFGELRRNLVDKFNYSTAEADEAVAILTSQTEVVSPAAPPRQICRDFDDDQILGTAIAGHAQCIVTGDKDLLVLGQFAGIRIVRPSDFPEIEK